VSVCAAIVVAVAASSASASAQDSNVALPKGWIVAAAPGIVGEPDVLKKLMNATDGLVAPDREPADGVYAEFGNMITGAGWISLGPGYRRHVFHEQAVVDVSAAVSWKLYQVVQGRFELPHLAHRRLLVGGQVRYQDARQVDYFGLGNDVPPENGSAYRFRNSDVLGYATVRPKSWLSVNGRFGWIPRADVLKPEGPRLSMPSTIDRFDETSAPGIASQPPLLHADAALVVDWTDHAGHPARGGTYRAAAAAYSDRDNGTYSFRRYELEAAQYIPLLTTKWILALHGWGVVSDTADGQVVPFYLLPSLGGSNTLRGYTDFRFHDRNMEVFNVESRWALFSHVDVAVFADAGKVEPRADDLSFGHLKQAYGAGLRLHNASSTLARLDVGHGTEGWHLFFKISEPLKRSAPASGRSSVVPFIP
jgi:Omp85 superfamily domain